jgi:hypothetical protein
MKRITVVSASVALALGIAALVNVARAADPTPQQLRQEQMARRCGDMDARMAAHLAYAEAKLKLTDAQKAGFKRLSDTVKESSAPMRKQCEQRFDQAQTLPERLARMQKIADARAESLRKLVPVMSDFYASLSLEQQKVADDLMPGMGGGKGGGWGGGHGHHGGGWGGGRHGMMGPS